MLDEIEKKTDEEQQENFRPEIQGLPENEALSDQPPGLQSGLPLDIDGGNSHGEDIIQPPTTRINRQPFFSIPKQNSTLLMATAATGAGIALNLVDNPVSKTMGTVLSTAGFFGVQITNKWTRQSKRRPIKDQLQVLQQNRENTSIELQRLRPIIDDYGLHLNNRDTVSVRFLHLLASFLYIAAGALLITKAFDKNDSLPLGVTAAIIIPLAMLIEVMSHILGNHNLDRYLAQLKEANQSAAQEPKPPRL